MLSNFFYDLIHLDNIYNYQGNYEEHLLDHYKLYVKMADNISQRRANVNTFFLSVNTLLVSFIDNLLIVKYIIYRNCKRIIE